MGGAGSGRYKRSIMRELSPLKTRNLNFKLDFFKALDDYQVKYNTQQIANSNRLYQYIESIFSGISGVRFSKYVNLYKKERK